MATVIIAKNQTLAALPLKKLPVPGNSLLASPNSVTLTNYASVVEIQNDNQLAAYVAVSDVVLNLNGVDLSASEAASVLTTTVTTSDPALTNLIHDNIAGEIAALTEKAVLSSGDWVLIEDSSAANAKKKAQVGSVSGGGSKYLMLTFEAAGEYEVGSQVGGRRYNRTGASWTIVDVTLHRESAGNAGSTAIDVNVDGVTIYTTQGNRPTIGFAEGDNAVDQGGTPDVLAVPTDGFLTLDIDEVEDDGENVTVVVTVNY